MNINKPADFRWLVLISAFWDWIRDRHMVRYGKCLCGTGDAERGSCWFVDFEDIEPEGWVT